MRVAPIPPFTNVNNAIVDHWIRRMALRAGDVCIVTPNSYAEARSVGVSSYGDTAWPTSSRSLRNVINAIVDPFAFDEKGFVTFEGDV